MRRPAGFWTPAVQALLEHLEAAGFEGAPRPRGIDDEGREVLTYVDGIAGGDDMAEQVYRDGRPVAFIDWDVAAPAPRLWDVAHAVWRFVDITHAADAAEVPALAARTRLFCDAYGLVDRSSLLETVLARQHALHATIREFADAGDPAFAAMWGTGHSEGPLRDAEFLRRHRRAFARALA